MEESQEQIGAFYPVQKILNKRIVGNTVEYLIKWKGWKEKTWQPIENLFEIPEMIDEYQEKNKKNRKQIQRKSINRIAKKQFCEDDYHIEEKQTIQKGKKKRLAKDSKRYLAESFHSQQKEAAQYIIKDKNDKIVNQQQEMMMPLRKSRTNKDNKQNGPRIKITKIIPEQNYVATVEEDKKVGNIYFDRIKRICKLERRNGKCHVEIEFFNNKYQKIWVQRDIIRILYPRQLYNFYSIIEKGSYNFN